MGIVGIVCVMGIGDRHGTPNLNCELRESERERISKSKTVVNMREENEPVSSVQTNHSTDTDKGLALSGYWCTCASCTYQSSSLYCGITGGRVD